jgi:hypothetical protein
MNSFTAFLILTFQSSLLSLNKCSQILILCTTQSSLRSPFQSACSLQGCGLYINTNTFGHLFIHSFSHEGVSPLVPITLILYPLPPSLGMKPECYYHTAKPTQLSRLTTESLQPPPPDVHCICSRNNRCGVLYPMTTS